MSEAKSFPSGAAWRLGPGRSCRLLVLALAVGVMASCINKQSTHLAYVTTGNGGIQAFRIKNGDGKVTSVFTSPFLVGDSAAGIVVLPSNNSVLVSNQNDGTISLLEIDSTSGTLTEMLPRTPAGVNPGPMVLDANGGFLYVADQGLNQVLVFSVGVNGALSQVSSVQLAQTPTSLTLSSNGLLFVPVSSLSDIYVFSINSGVLTQVCFGTGPVCLPFSAANGVSSVAVDPAGKFLYVPNPNADGVSGFSIGANGTLTPVPVEFFTTGTGTAPTAAAVDPSGKFLYVVNTGSTTISEFTIDPSSGTLTAFATPTQGVGTGPEFLMFDPDGEFAYVADSSSKSFTQLLLLPDGTFFSTGNTIQVGSTPLALALTK